MSAIVDGRGRPGAYTIEQRFWGKVDGGDVADCWTWKGARSSGYGRFAYHGRTVLTHRWAYERLIGAIPEGLHLDHLCRNRACVNPWHLDPVTCLVNVRRSPLAHGSETECPHGHPYDSENTYWWNGRRKCRTCNKQRGAEFRTRATTREQAAA